jgi:ABC-type molybdenum transport system ATPase subunit/photorepair protein PhrA
MKEIIFEQFSLFTPNNQKLFGPISLKITEGSKWLLTGPNGIGKSTTYSYFHFVPSAR